MTRPLRVLLVEDSERDAALLKLYLKRGGYEPVLERVETKEAMLDRLSASAWDIVISDGRLPSFSAAAALATLRENRSALPFLMVSGELDEQTVSQLDAAGGAGCFRKGDFAQILAAIEKALPDDAS
jgi:CheY-like chemotaxis protein